MTLNDHIVIGDKKTMELYMAYSEFMYEINNHIDVSCVEAGICYFLVNNGIHVDKRLIDYTIIRTVKHVVSKKKRMKYFKHVINIRK